MKTSLITLSACLVLAGGAFSEDYTRTETLTFTLSQGDDVEIYNINGDIILEESGASDLELTYVISCDDLETLDHINVEFDTGDGLECSVEYDDDWDDFGDNSVDFTVYVPAGTELGYEIAFVNGNIVLSGGSGASRLELVNGDISVEGFEGDLVTSLVNGNIELSGSSGLKKAELVSGSINCELSSILNDIELDAVSGDVNLDLLTSARVVVETISGEIAISSDYNATVEENYVGRSSEFGDGEFTVVINTISGNVSVKD
ncbi:MAG: DUF4097 family beta strand repeat protein [Candidatus Fermentibacteraceae bacterium]|nr:DUF4097 family beta strand repeat protein [Candidatus Fermentibacteraceae bacterium]MBN2607468.1 DUF4097 family beta strand repeat protein [Candidatus Fermentibacteraceae bacterium]